MKNLEEKKLLLQMMRAFGQDDKDLSEQIRREEELTKLLFKEEKQQSEQVLIEVAPIEQLPPQPAKPAETNLQPPEEYKVQQVTNYLDTVSNTKKPPLVAALQDNEFQALRKTVQDLLQKVNTLSWGGGGTGAVRIFDQDDFDRSTVGNGKYMKWQDGWFVMDEINPFEVVHNTTLVTSNTYVVQEEDYYIGVDFPGEVTIIIPSEPSSGREIVVKDESGNCANNPIIVSGPVDNDNSGFILEVDNGAVHMLFRGDYWRII